MSNPSPISILDCLNYYAKKTPDKTLYTLLDRHCREVDTITFLQLQKSVNEAALNLYKIGVSEGDLIALTASSGKDFITIFLGALAAGIVPVPLPAPRGKRQVDRIKNIFEQHGFNTIIADQSSSPFLEQDKSIDFISSNKVLTGNEEYDAAKLGENLPTLNSKNTAFLQFTSGSTSKPKGVMISHKNIITNEQYIHDGFGHSQDSVILGWLPFHHDMGLIGNMLQPIYAGASSIVMSPMDFLRKPVNWLKMIAKYKATTSGGPNFAYDLCVSSVNTEELTGVDLSHWQVAFNGSEMIQNRTLKLFSDKFEPFGFNKSSYQFCYGLAEATLYVTSAKYNDTVLHEQAHKVNVGCGQTLGNTQVKIVNPFSFEELPKGEEGEIWVSGGSIADGYWQDQKNTETTFKAYTAQGNGPFMRTGDLGYWYHNQLFISGRHKNLLIIRGQNIHPIDIESAIHDQCPELVTYRSAIFIGNELQERLVILHEVAKSLLGRLDVVTLSSSIRARVAEEFQIDVQEVVFVRENILPRTTSGKIQVEQSRQQFYDGNLKTLYVDSLAEKSHEDTITKVEAPSKESLVRYIASLLNLSNSAKISETKALVEYGLDSIKAVKLAHFFEDYFSVNLDVSDILGGSTIDELYNKALESNRVDFLSDDIDTKSDRTLLAQAPISYQQENIWIAQQSNPIDCSYNIPIVLKVDSSINCRDLSEAIEDVLNKYPLTNVVFEQREREVIQRVSNRHDNIVTINDLSDLSEESFKIILDQLIDKQFNTPFDLSRERPVRGVLITQSDRPSFLLLTFHHIICDGWSFNILQEDLVKRLSSQPCTDTSTTVGDYFSYAQSQRRKLPGLSPYWLNKIKGVEATPALSQLWQEINDDSAVGGRGDEIDYRLNDYQSSLVKNLCSQLSVSAATVFMGLFHQLLNNYLQASNTLINYVSANRQSSKTGSVFGCFVNTLVSRMDFNNSSENNNNIENICRQLSRELLSNSKEESYPFVELNRLAGKATGEYSNPLSRYFFVMQNAPQSVSEGIEIIHQKTRHAMYDIVLEVSFVDDGYHIKFEYKNNVINKLLMQHYVNSYIALLERIGNDNPMEYQVPVGTLDLSPAEPLLKEIQDDKEVFDFYQRFSAQVNKTPNKVAVVDDNRQLTYQELFLAAKERSKLLLEDIREDNSRVILACERNCDYIVNLIAVISLNCCYCPVDVNSPESTIDDIINEINPCSILCSDINYDKFNKYSTLCRIGCNKTPRLENRCLSLAHQNYNSINNAAYVIYTSGSTGHPKGIEVSRKSLNLFIKEAVALFDINESDKVLQFSALNWDTSSEEIFPTLVSGATLVLRSNQQVEHYQDLLDRTQENEVTVWNLPSSYWQELVNYLNQTRDKIPASLRLLIVGGEPVSSAILQQWFNQHEATPTLLNTYGATELTSISLACDLTDFYKNNKATNYVPAGRPLSYCYPYILDKSLRPLPVGTIGQLYIGGEGLSKGYLDNSDLNKKMFIKHPEVGQRIYNTGDFAYYDHFGNVFVSGRNDSIVKRRGIRIDINAIANTSQSLPEIHFATTDAVYTAGKNTVIELHVVIKKTDLPIVAQKLNEILSTTLGNQFLPDKIFYTHEIPRLPNNKVDIKRLKTITRPILVSTNQSKSQNIGGTEKKIIELWQRILGHDQFDRSSGFNDVGGNSLLILSLKTELDNEFSTEVPVSELFANPSCRQQAELIDKLVLNRPEEGNELLELLEALESEQIDLETVKKSLNI